MNEKDKYIQEKQEIQKILAQIDQGPVEKMVDVGKILDGFDKIFHLELNEMGYRYDGRSSPNNNFKVKYSDKQYGQNRKRIDSYGSFQAVNKPGELPTITMNVSYLLEKLLSPDADLRTNEVFEFLVTAFHELQHARQELMMKTNVSSKNNLNFARETVVTSWADEWYHQNYDQILSENEACKVGYEKAYKLFGKFSGTKTKNNLGKIYRRLYQGKMSTGVYQTKLQLDSGPLYDREKVLVPMVDELIGTRGYVEILQEYPILLKEFNPDGTKKTADVLIKNMQDELQKYENDQNLDLKERTALENDCRSMYADLIYNQIVKYTPQEIEKLVQDLGAQQCTSVFQMIIEQIAHDTDERILDGKHMIYAEGYLENDDKETHKKRIFNQEKRAKGLQKLYKQKRNLFKKITKQISDDCSTMER